MGIPDHLTCLLRNLYAGQEATVRTGHGTTDWFQVGKGIRQGCILYIWKQLLRASGDRSGRGAWQSIVHRVTNSWTPLSRDQIASIRWIIKKAREFQKNIYFCFLDYAKAFDCVDHNKLWKILKEMGIPDHLTTSWEICIQVKKQQLELDMEQQTGSK